MLVLVMWVGGAIHGNIFQSKALPQMLCWGGTVLA